MGSLYLGRLLRCIQANTSSSRRRRYGVTLLIINLHGPFITVHTNQHIIIPQSPSWVAHCRLQIVKTFVAGEGILAQR